MIISLLFVGVLGIGMGMYALYLNRKLRKSEMAYELVCTNVGELERQLFNILKENNND